MERTDEQLLPAVYAYVAVSLNASPSQLGYITQSRALVQALASPLAGFAGKHLQMQSELASLGLTEFATDVLLLFLHSQG